MTKIKDIIWISEEIGEADVIVTDGKYEIICFSYPFSPKIGEDIDGTISIFENYDIMKSSRKGYTVNHLGNGKYFFVAKLVNRSKGIIKIGEIYINDIQGVPEKIQNGEFIQFFTPRVDLW